MTRPVPPADFTALPRALRAEAVDGLLAAIDRAAAAAPASHRFLRYQWYAAAIEAYGGHPRTLLIEHDGVALAALPLVGLGPEWLRLAQVPGCYWPFRSFPARVDAGLDTFAALAALLTRNVRGLRIGPVHDDDPAAQALIAAVRNAGWEALDRPVAETMRLDLAGLSAAGNWPRGSTLRKNRFHEKHLTEHGALEWRLLDGTEVVDALGRFGEIEARSWIAARTDGKDAKFTAGGHEPFWRIAAQDPVLAAMFRAALLSVAGRPAAFSFDLDTGGLRYAIANSFDPAFARHSPGKLLQYRNLRDALARGVRMVDWGAGDSGYKATLGAVEGPITRDWLLLRPGVPRVARRALGWWWRRSGQQAPEIAGDPADAR